MSPQAGRRNRKIEILSAASAENDVFGVTDLTYSSAFYVWAEFIPVSGREALSAGREVASRTAVFNILFKDGVTTKHRISHDGVQWDIIAIREIGYRDGLELLAEARQ
jgi:SPP1 family predicted phage head-tail adaptor